ncbi:MAG TPA: glycosyltransferase [Acidimicrobiales bacterium]|nr:glycosyltransferase [Acidimicrobiales bacterium]
MTSLLEAGVDVALVDTDVEAPLDPRRLPARLAALPTHRRYAIDLCMVNVNELHLLSDELLRPAGRDNYVIGCWYWELASLPPAIAEQVGRVDEIWVASSFVADAMRGCTSVPIVKVPAVVQPVADTTVTRAQLGIPEDVFAFCFSFDGHSTVARKNPFGLIEAYRMAFDRRARARDVALVIKSQNLRHLSEADAMLRAELGAVGGILIDGELSAPTMSALLGLCDAYVSLHRAEGFGLGLAEAMYLGKPVIATGYSGNTEFMTPLNSFPVPYQLEPVRLGDSRFNPWMERVYTPESTWASPDLGAAARWMRRIYEHLELGTRAGRRAATSIRAGHSSAIAGAAMRARLELLHGASDLGS